MKPVTETLFRWKFCSETGKIVPVQNKIFRKSGITNALYTKRRKRIWIEYNLNTTHFSEQHIKFYVTMLNTPAYVCQHSASFI